MSLLRPALLIRLNRNAAAFRHFHLFHARSHTHGVATLGQTVLEGCGEHVTFLASETRSINLIGNYGNDFFGGYPPPNIKEI